MAERCPLKGLVWDDNIPAICRENCEEVWDRAAKGQPEVDEFTHEKQQVHPYAGFEHGGEGLRRGESALRSYAISNNCDECGAEAFSEIYTFYCPNN